LAPGAAVRITTGAALPDGADTVVIKEQASLVGAAVQVPAGMKRGANVRAADDDFSAGALALPAGTVLRPEQIGVLASFGCDSATLRCRPRAMAFSTGDELVAPGQPLPPGRRYDSNQPMLAALLPRLGVAVTATARLPDDRVRLREALLRHAGDHDLLVTTGGVSAGEADFLPGVLAEIGTIAFWKVAMRPGMPVLCGRLGDCLVLALPGNPVSVYATALALLRPWLAAACGAPGLDPAPTLARLSTAVDKRHDRVEFRRGRLGVDGDGVQRAEVLSSASSGALSSVAAAEVLIEFPAAARRYDAGECLPVHRLP
jgi:molybdopterin molybdotransferase